MATLNGVNYSNTSGLLLKTNATTQMSISTGGVIEFNQSYTFPTSDGSANTVLLTNGSGALSFSTIPNASLDNSSVTLGSTSVSLGGTSTSINGLTSLSATTVNVGDVLRIDENGDGLRMTNVGAFDNSSGNFRIFATSDLILSTNGETGTAVTFDSSTKDAVFVGNIIGSFSGDGSNIINIPNAGLDNSSITINGSSISLGGSITVGDITAVTAGNGLTGGGTSGSVTLNVGAGTGISVAADSVSIDYAGTNNFIDSATNLEGTSIAAGDTIVYHDATDNNVKKGFVSDLPFSNNSGTVTSVSISGTDGIDVDSGSPITSSGTITLGLSNIPNSSLQNSSIDIAGSDISLGGQVTGDDIISDVSAGQITNSQLSNSSFTVNAPSGTDPVVPLGGTFNIISSDSSVTISGNSTTDTIDLVVGNSVNTYVTGGTFTSGTLSLGLNDGSSAQDITGLWSSIPNSALANSSVTVTAGSGLVNGGSVSLGGSVTLNVGAGTGISVAADTVGLDTSNTRNVDHGSVSISAGTGLSGGGTIASSRTISLDYAGTNNFIDSASNLEGTTIALTDTIVYHDATDNNVKKGLVSDLPFTNSSGSVTSVAISGSDGIDVDSGSPITSSGTIALGLSNVPNSSLANSSITINGTAVSLGGTINVGDITSVGAGTGLSGGGTSGAVTINVDYLGTDNIILAAGAYPNDIQGTDFILVSDSDNNAKKATVTALPFSNNQGTVTSVAISGTDGIDVDSGSPITTNGTITLGLSNVPNSSLANSSVTITGGNGLTGGGSVSLGGSVTLNVGAGTLIDVDGSNVNVDLSELATSTSDGDGDYFVVVNTSNAQRKLTKGNINLSGFNDNISLYKADGTLTGTRTVTQGGNDLLFETLGSAQSKFYRSMPISNSVSRVYLEANDDYQNVLELYSTVPTTALIEGYDAGQAPVFRVDGQGNLTAVSKAFDIPHPNPEKKEQGMRLKHGNLEGPEHGVYVRGRQLNDKEIELPEYWRDLVDPDSITVQLTSVGSHQNLYVKEIKDNVVYIGNGNLFSNKIDCYYFIQAERKDIEKITVEY